MLDQILAILTRMDAALQTIANNPVPGGLSAAEAQRVAAQLEASTVKAEGLAKGGPPITSRR